MTVAVMPPPDAVNIPRAASYTYLPALKDTIFEEASNLDEKGSFSEDDLIGPATNALQVQLPHAPGHTVPEDDPDELLEGSDTLSELSLKSSAANALQRSDTTATNIDGDDAELRSTPASDAGSRPGSLSRSLSQRLKSQSWMPGSRSPSPKKVPSRDQSPANTGRRTPNRLTRRSAVIESGDKESRSRSSSLTKKGSELTRRFSRPLSTVSSGVASEHSTPIDPVNSKSLELPKSWSSEKLPLPAVVRSIPSSERVPPVRRMGSSEKLRTLKPELRKKDELWSVFRALDGDVQKFNSKPSPLKTAVVRASLLPFLRNYRNHPSDYKLRPEDLDRRTNILNKWWTGLLDLLHGRNNQSISPTERPVIFEAIIGIMERPEWRLAPSPFCPLRDRKSSKPCSRSASSTSLSSDGSDFLQESINHNIRNNFIQNLLAQMNFVVLRMSERSTPASLVQFCGRTCAYAFFFCEGVADVLVRLWGPSMDLLKRVVAEADLQGLATLGATSKLLVSGFPPSIRSLEFTGLSSTYRKLRKPVSPPLGTHDAPWKSPLWISRWNGTESELFYVFVKYYHLLLMDFLPEQASKKERLTAPGVVMVHAQVLTNIDATINRHAIMQNEQLTGPSNITFDDVLSDPDASTPALSFALTSNANRQMAENRVIMLVRDFLSDRQPLAARRVFAEAFSDALKATARRTSVFSQNACYTLCDLLEEAFVILVRYEHSTELEHCALDFAFWLDVFKRMVQSQNTTTEIRLYSLLYSLWIPITMDSYRKRDLCYGLLLEPEFFNGRFNHWCPMVRAYFMRLLAWRVGRYDGDSEPKDIDIFRMLADRLNTVYGYYIYLRQEAQLNGTVEPSALPCNPAPSRCLIIVRTDPLVSTTPGSSFLSLEGISSAQSLAIKRSSTFGGLSSADMRPKSESTNSSSDNDRDDDGNKRWSILRTIIGPSRQQRTGSQSPVKSNNEPPSHQSSTVSPTTHSSTQRQQSQQQRQSDQEPAFRTFCFKFSLEFNADRRRTDHTSPVRLPPPRLPPPAQQLLQNHSSRAQPDATPTETKSDVSGTDGIDTNGDTGNAIEAKGIEPNSPWAVASAKYSGRALAEWELVVWECQSFFERRKGEGVPGNRYVETPTLGVEAFRRPG